jgi:hypothetical protein
MVLGIKPKTLYMLGKYSTTCWSCISSPSFLFIEYIYIVKAYPFKLENIKRKS